MPLPPEILYACPYCKRSGFSHRGLSAHFCSEAPPAPGALTGAGKRFLTKPEIAKIVVATSTQKPVTP